MIGTLDGYDDEVLDGKQVKRLEIWFWSVEIDYIREYYKDRLFEGYVVNTKDEISSESWNGIRGR